MISPPCSNWYVDVEEHCGDTWHDESGDTMVLCACMDINSLGLQYVKARLMSNVSLSLWHFVTTSQTSCHMSEGLPVVYSFLLVWREKLKMYLQKYIDYFHQCLMFHFPLPQLHAITLISVHWHCTKSSTTHFASPVIGAYLFIFLHFQSHTRLIHVFRAKADMTKSRNHANILDRMQVHST